MVRFLQHRSVLHHLRVYTCLVAASDHEAIYDLGVCASDRVERRLDANDPVLGVCLSDWREFVPVIRRGWRIGAHAHYLGKTQRYRTSRT